MWESMVMLLWAAGHIAVPEAGWRGRLPVLPLYAG